MKFGYAIVLALVALVAVSGFAAADRLPQQVPENQIFTIDTLIDVTGAVSEKSEMQLTIISGELPLTGIEFDQNSANPGDRNFLNAQAVAAINTAVTGWVATYGGNAARYVGWGNVILGTTALNYLNVPDAVLDSIANPQVFAGMTWRQVLAAQRAIIPVGLAANPYRDTTANIQSSLHDTMLFPGEEIAILTWTDSLRTNGGKLALNKNIDFDSRNKGNGLSNLEVEKVLTYASTEGAHLVGGEEWMLDVAGSFERASDSIRCVFASTRPNAFPAFCNVVKAKSELININSAQISTKGAARAIAATGDIPAMLNYQIAVTPDSNSGSGFADGTVKTAFGGAIMEARGNNLVPSATNNWKDEASVTGGIKNFQKTFNYESGFKF